MWRNEPTEEVQEADVDPAEVLPAFSRKRSRLSLPTLTPSATARISEPEILGDGAEVPAESDAPLVIRGWRSRCPRCGWPHCSGRAPSVRRHADGVLRSPLRP